MSDNTPDDTTNGQNSPLPPSTSETTTTTSASATNTDIGYCHVCDRQVPINREAFTCGVCNGGFIELFETPPQPAPQEQQPQQQMFTTRLPADGNLMSILPMLLPQLLGQMTGGQQPQINIRTHQHSPQQTGSPQQSGTNQPRHSATRLQFIVPNSEPGGQVDLYGVINNVLSDLLMRPANLQGIPQQSAQFHFQPPPIRMFQLHGDMRDYAWGEGGLDTIITQLLNQLTNTGPPPATEEQVINLPLVKISEEEFAKNMECSICMEDFRLHEEAKKLPCKHYFHEPCITEWLKLHGTCPVCRKDLTGEDTSQREYIQPPPSGTADVESAMDAGTTSEGGDSQAGNTTVTSTNSNSENRNNSQQASGSIPGTDPEVYNDMEFD